MIGYFTTQRWTFSNDNVQRLWAKLDADDRNLFHFNMDDINWPEALNGSILGIRHYLLKEDPASIPDALLRAKR